MQHESWMKIAYELAYSTIGQTSPNPSVGSVVVKSGRMVGSGAHLQPGQPHAEVLALDMAKEEARGSTLYVTLEPCNHYGRTPPCTSRILASGVKRVVIGTVDPDHRVTGQGILRLQEAGVEVITSVMEKECYLLNEAYFHHRRTGKPFVTLKTATTLDGKIATESGDSRWITGEDSRRYVHQLRHQSDAILVGIGTVLADNPRLTTRLPEGEGLNPIRIILDTRLRIPLEAEVTKTDVAPTWVFTGSHIDNNKKKALESKGVQVIPTSGDSQVNLEETLSILGEKGVLSLLIEGGGEVNASLLNENKIQKVIAFIAPKLIGGRESPTSMEGRSPQKMADSWNVEPMTFQAIGEDLCLTGYIQGGNPSCLPD